jgi:hypothetical protein
MADNDYKLPRRFSLAGPQRPAIAAATATKNPTVEGTESALESGFSRPPKSAFGDLEKQ